MKSHGGSDANGVAAALRMADELAHHPFQEEIKATVEKVTRRSRDINLEDVEGNPATIAKAAV